MNLRTKGFSLIEMLVTLAIGGLLLTLILPAFSQSLQRSQADSELNELLRALNYARFEAIERGITTHLRPMDDSRQWAAALGVYDGAAPQANVLRVVPALSRGAILALPSGIDAVAFSPLGGLAGADRPLLIRYERGALQRSISVCLNGRIIFAGSCQ